MAMLLPTRVGTVKGLETAIKVDELIELLTAALPYVECAAVDEAYDAMGRRRIEKLARDIRSAVKD